MRKRICALQDQSLEGGMKKEEESRSALKIKKDLINIGQIRSYKSAFYVLIIFLVFCGLLSFSVYTTQKKEALEKKNLLNIQRVLHEDLVKDLTAVAVQENYNMKKVDNDLLVLYAYYETDDSRINIVHFFHHGLHAYADFILIINGKSDVDQLLPKNISNIKVIRRNNSCFDLGSEAEVLRANDYELVKKYKRFILMNGSVRGPFLPTYVESCWTDIFTNKLDDEIKLVGTTYNYWAYHIQSMVLATDRIGIEILLAGNETHSTAESDAHYIRDLYEGNPESLVGLVGCPSTKFHAVSAEISLTQLIRKKGYKVAVLMTAANADQLPESDENSNRTHLASNSFNLASVHPYEVVFIKARRGWENSMNQILLEKLTEWHNKLNYSSWEVCKIND